MEFEYVYLYGKRIDVLYGKEQDCMVWMEIIIMDVLYGKEKDCME